MKRKKNKYRFTFKYFLFKLIFRLIFNPFAYGLLLLYIIFQQITAYLIMGDEIFIVIEQKEGKQIQEMETPEVEKIEQPKVEEDKVTQTTEIKEIMIKEQPKEQYPKEGQPKEELSKEEPFDFFTKKELERLAEQARLQTEMKKIIDDRVLKDQVEMEEIRIATQEEEYSYPHTTPQPTQPTIQPVTILWDLNLPTINKLLYNYANARVLANYNGDISILMNFVSDNLPDDILNTPGSTIYENNEAVDTYLSIIEDNMRYLPENSHYEFKFYKISILTYMHCLANNTLHDAEQVQAIFDKLKDQLL